MYTKLFVSHLGMYIVIYIHVSEREALTTRLAGNSLVQWTIGK